MVKYVETFVGLREIPDEIVLCSPTNNIIIKPPNNDIFWTVFNSLKNISKIYFCGSPKIDLYWTIGLKLELISNIELILLIPEIKMIDPSPELFFRGIPFNKICLGTNFENLSYKKIFFNDKNNNKIYEI